MSYKGGNTSADLGAGEGVADTRRTSRSQGAQGLTTVAVRLTTALLTMQRFTRL